MKYNRNTYYKLFFILLLFCSFTIKKLYSENTDSKELKYSITSDTAVLDSIIFSGQTYFDKDILYPVGKDFIGLQISQKLIDAVIDRYLNFYLDKSFPLVNLVVDSIKTDDKKALLALKINSDKYTMMYGIKFKGNDTSKEDILLRETRLNTPAPFRQKDVNTAINYLYKTGKFVTKPEAHIALNTKNYSYLFNLREDKYNAINGLIGYSAGGTNSGFNGEFELLFGNIFGTFREVSVFWKRLIDDDEKLSLSYTEPWLYKWPLKTVWGFSQEFKKNLYLEREYGLDMDYNLNFNLNILAGTSFRQIFPDSLYMGGIDADQTKYYTGLKFSNIPSYESIDEGIITEIKISGISKNEQNRSREDAELELNVAGNLNIWKDFYLRNDSRFKQIYSKDTLAVYDLYPIGGSSSIRGYREDQFLSSLTLVTRNELYFKLSRVSGLFIAGDLGFYEDNGKDIKYLFGYGGGIKFNTAVGEMKVVYAIPHTEGLDFGKVHFRYISRF